MKKRYLFAVLPLFVASLAASCGCETMNSDEPVPTPQATLSKITLDTASVKKTFELNETFTYSGLKVTAVYSDQSSKLVTDYAVSTPDMTTAGDKTVTVTYLTKSATYSIKVNEGELPPVTPTQTGIEISSANVQKEFTVNDTFNYDGLIVYSVWSDGDKKQLAANEYNVAAPDMTTAGEKDVVITSGNFSASYKINVKEGEPGPDIPPDPENPLAEKDWYFCGTVGGVEGWDPVEGNKLAKTEKQEGATFIYQYKITKELGVGDKFKITDDGEGEARVWVGALEEGVDGLYINGEDYGNIYVSTAGTYDIYLKVYGEDSYSIYAERTSDPVVPPDPEEPLAEKNWYFCGTVGGVEGWNPVEGNKLAKTEKQEGETFIYQYKITKELGVGDKFKITDDGIGEARVWVGALEEGVDGLYINGEDYGNIYVSTAGTYDIYLKVYGEDSYSIWAKRTSNPDVPPGREDPLG